MFPLCYLKPWRMGQPFLNACTHGVTSYVVVRILVTFVAFCTAMAGKYDDGEIAGNNAYIYLASINFFSQVAVPLPRARARHT
jgi:hypothetical protein